MTRQVCVPLLINQASFRAILDNALLFWQFHLVLFRMIGSFVHRRFLSPRASAFSVDFYAHNVLQLILPIVLQSSRLHNFLGRNYLRLLSNTVF